MKLFIPSEKMRMENLMLSGLLWVIINNQINNKLAEYLELKDGKMGATFADIPVDYDAVINDLVINIDRIN